MNPGVRNSPDASIRCVRGGILSMAICGAISVTIPFDTRTSETYGKAPSSPVMIVGETNKMGIVVVDVPLLWVEDSRPMVCDR